MPAYPHTRARPVAQPLESRCLLAAMPVADLNAGPASGFPFRITDVNGVAFFAASGAGMGRELHRSDGTEAGTVMVKDIVPGPGSSDPEDLINVNGTLFFTARPSERDFQRRELWRSDGTAAGTVRVTDLNLYHVGHAR